MSGRENAVEAMQAGMAKLIAQGLTFGTGAALWSANRVLDVAEALADAAAPAKKAPERPDDRVWTDPHLDRLRLPPRLLTIDLEKTGRSLIIELATAALHQQESRVSGDVPPSCREAFVQNGSPLSDQALVIGEAAGSRGLRWTIWDAGEEMDAADDELVLYGLRRQNRSLEITPVVKLEPENADANRLLGDRGVARDLVTVDSELLAGLNNNIAAAPVAAEPLSEETKITFLGGAVLARFGDHDFKLNLWEVTDRVNMILLVGEAERAELEAYLVVEHFEARRVKKWIGALDRGEVPEQLRPVFRDHGYSLSTAAWVQRRASQIRWQISDPKKKTSYTLINGGGFITVFEDPGDEDRYVDPVGDRVAEHFLELVDPVQRVQHLMSHFLAGDIKGFVSEAHVLSRGRPYEVLGWLRGQRDRLEPAEGGTKGSMEMIRDFFGETAKPPAWVDKKLLADGEKAFDLYKIPYMTALLFGALPQTYACWKGAQVLTTTGRLAIDPTQPRKQQLERLHHRVAATAQFVLNIMQKGAFQPDGIGLRTTQTLRLLHAGIRFVIRNEGPGRDPNRRPWNYERLGRPINQEDMLGTMLAFSVVTFDKLHALNVKLSDHEEEALFHRWKLMGFYLGIHEDQLRKLATVDDGRYLWQRISSRQQDYQPHAPEISEAQNCADLTTAVIEYTRTVTTAGLPAEMAEYLVRYMAGRVIADRLSVPETDLQVWARAATMLGRFNFGAIQMLKDNSPLARAAFSRINDVVYQAVFDTWVSDKPVTYYRSEDDDEATDSDGEENDTDASPD